MIQLKSTAARAAWLGAMTFALWGCGESTSGGSLAGPGAGPGTQPGAMAPGSVGTPENPDELDVVEQQQYLAAANAWFDAKPFVIAPWAKVLDSQDTKAVVVEEDSLIFPATPENQKAYRVGDILVSSNIDEGKVFLRRITGITQSGGTLEFATELAGITDVVMGGTLTEMPTGTNPDAEAQSFGTMTQQLGLGSVFPSFSVLRDSADDEGTLGTAAPSGLKFKIEPILESPGFSAPNTDFNMDASIDPSPGSRNAGRLGVGATDASGTVYTSTHTTCAMVTAALEFIQGNRSDQRSCRSSYDAWISSSSYPRVTSAHVNSDVTYVRVLSDNVRRLQCRHEDGGWFWFDSEILMPYPEEVQWAQRNCGGVLESFDMSARFDPTFTLGKGGLKFEAEYGRELLPSAVLKQRDAFLSKDTWKVLWIGWFPIVLRLEGKIVAGFWKFTGKGEVETGFQNVSAGVDAQMRLRYTGGPLTSQSSWTGSSSLTSRMGGEFFFDGTLSGTVEREFVGLEGGIYLYDSLGPKLVPAALYGRADAAANVGTTDRSMCNFGITGGVKGELTIDGRIPFTSYPSVSWKLWEYDSCGSGNRLNKAFYEQETSFCLKHCINSLPLEVVLEWEQVTDLDIEVIDPDGNSISYASPNFAGAVHENPNGCLSDRCEAGDTHKETIFWARTPKSGAYKVVVTNASGTAAAPFTVKVKAQRQNGTAYFEEDFSGTAQADNEFSTEFNFSLPAQP